MTDNERKEVWSILNTISDFIARINNRMECVVCPEEQQKNERWNTEGTWKHGFFWNKRGKRRWEIVVILKLVISYLLIKV